MYFVIILSLYRVQTDQFLFNKPCAREQAQGSAVRWRQNRFFFYTYSFLLVPVDESFPVLCFVFYQLPNTRLVYHTQQLLSLHSMNLVYIFDVSDVSNIDPYYTYMLNFFCPSPFLMDDHRRYVQHGISRIYHCTFYASIRRVN